MKKDCEILKYVYRELPSRGGYWRKTKYTDQLVSLSEEFPAASYVSQFAFSFTIRYSVLSDVVTIWKDKHGNIVVRILRTSHPQTKINFYHVQS